MKVIEVDRSQIQEWYPKFKSVSIPTIIHQLPQSFLDYLLDSGTLQLPLSISNEDALPNRVHNPVDEVDYQLTEGSSDEDEDDDDESSLPPCFPDLELQIKKSIEALGGAVFPKLNWSSPKDAAWISSSRNLRCTTFSEIALLLKSSDSLVHDLSHAYDSCCDRTESSTRPSSFYIALRKWYSSILPEREFRCFVRGHRLVGISQREVTTCYPLILAERHGIRELIVGFFEDRVRMKFESDDYTFDVYVTNDGRVKVLDFNPWAEFTLPLLFTWEELERALNHGVENDEDVELRVVESRCGIRPGLKTAVPREFLEVGPGSGWEQVLTKAFEELQQQQEEASDDDDD